MKSYNKGEWSEVYTFLKCLVDKEFHVKDSNLDKTLEKYNILNIEKQNNSNTETNFFSPEEIDNIKFKKISEKLLKELNSTQNTTFSIDFIEKFAKEEDFSLSKGSSKEKADLIAKIIDKHNKKSKLEYSIKSQLSSPATLLNASNHTNFIYKIENITEDEVVAVNSINSKYKLKERIEYLKKHNKIISFEKVNSEKFEYNLSLIDSNLSKILGEILLISYENSEKNLDKLVKLIYEKDPLNFNDISIYKDKIKKFLMEITSYMMPSEKLKELKSENNIFGGLLIVEKDGKISLLDNIYYRKHLKKYLIDNLKLDSPSSTRYNMLNLQYDPSKKEATFTLNLQIRFKK